MTLMRNRKAYIASDRWSQHSWWLTAKGSKIWRVLLRTRLLVLMPDTRPSSAPFSTNKTWTWQSMPDLLVSTRSSTTPCQNLTFQESPKIQRKATWERGSARKKLLKKRRKRTRWLRMLKEASCLLADCRNLSSKNSRIRCVRPRSRAKTHSKSNSKWTMSRRRCSQTRGNWIAVAATHQKKWHIVFRIAKQQNSRWRLYRWWILPILYLQRRLLMHWSCSIHDVKISN